MMITALSGSLRAVSLHSSVLRAASRLAPRGVAIELCLDIGALPLFNPDLEEALPEIVVRFRRRIGVSNALLIASPEYAHGIAGALKNALDWLVGSQTFAGMPVAVLNVSARARHADLSLREILTTMAAVVVEPASVRLAMLKPQMDEEAVLGDRSCVEALRDSIQALLQAASPGNAAA